jgi:gliding motility-associated-like protein
MKRIFTIILTAVSLLSLNSYAQQGILGPKTVTAANTIVNEYTAITALIPAGSTSITVAASSLNANGRFATNLQPGDLIMLYQAQGAIIRDLGISPNPDTAWGRIDPGNYYSTGLYEFRQVVSVPNATTIVIDCGTTNQYIPNGGTARKPQVIRVPRYTSLTINSGGVLTCDDWNGTTGGVLAVEVQGNTVINAGGIIDGNGKGFRGGSLVGDNATVFGSNTNATTNNAEGAEKGESLAGYQAEYDPFGGRYSRAAPANGGGGGSGHNGGGGGGANAPNSTSASCTYSGLGIPDQTGVGWTAAWNLEAPVNTMSLRTSANSAGGGRGGYTFSGGNQNATTTGPDNAAWGGDNRRSNGTGLGGRPLDYTVVAAQGYSRLFLGGGGGAGDQNNSGGGVGGDGGGLIYLMVFGNISGSGTVQSNGLNGANAVGGTGVITGIDGGGGGGGGGAIVLNAVGGVANTITVNANGGNGGNQVINLPFSSNEGEGPGGGGGGGYISVSSGTPTRNANGGVNGTTNSGGLTEFTPNGATKGCPGTNNATITNFNITTTNITICTGSSTTLTATITGTLPPGAVINWYTASVGGSPIFTGNPYTTPALASTTTYWVGTCAGWWRVPVTVTVGPAPVVSASASPSTICSGSSSTLTGSGATTYSWMPGSLSGTSVVVSPSTTTTYTVTGSTAPGCSSTAQVTVTVNPTPTVTATASPTTICAGSSSTLTGSGAASYSWNPGALSGSPVSVSPGSTTTYTVTGTTTGCSSTAQVTVTVNPSPTVTATASSPTICSGNSTNLTGGGAVSYVWNPGAISGSPISVSPAATTTYTVTGTGGNGCTSTAQVTVTVNTTPTVTATASSPTICSGNSTNLTGSGATSYTWNPGALSGSPVSVSPGSTTTYTVTGTSGTCSSTAQVTVTVNPSPTVTATASSPTICNGNSTTLTGGGAVSYVWNPGAIPGSSVSVSPTSTTTYTVTGTGGNSCTSTAQVTVTVNPTPTVTATASSPTICSGNSTNLTGGGAVSYVWNPGAIPGSPISVTPAATTTYTVTGTGGNGCTSTAQVTVTVNTTPTVTATATSPTICAGQSTTLNGGGAGSYVWNPGALAGSSVSVTPASTTTYTVTGTSGTCSSTAQVTVTVNPLPTPTATATPATICNGQSSSLSGTGGTTYTWNGGALVNANGTPQTVSPSSTTTYTVDVTDAAGCSASTQVTLTVNPLPVPNAGTDQTICSGNSASLLASGGGTYTWNGGALVNANGAAQTVSPGSTTSYTVTVTNGFGCQQNDTMTVNVNTTPTTSAGPDVTICSTDTTQLNATGAGSFVWNPSSGLSNPNISNPQANPVSTTTYTVTLTAGNGCSNNDTITVNVNARPVAVASNDTTICSASTISIMASGGSTYVWNGGALVNAPGATQSVAPSSPVSYVVTVTAANGCTDEDTVNVAVNALPTTNAGPDVSICPNSSIQLNATGATNYNWSPSAGLSATNIPNPVANPASTTTYTVTGTNAAGCSQNDTITVTVANNLSVFAGPDITMCSGDTILLSTSGGTTYSWSPALSLQTPNASSTNAFPTSTTTYTVNVTDANSCTGADTITVFVNGPVNLSSSGSGTICIGQSASINATPSNGVGPYTYNWSNSLSGPGPQTVSPVTTTTYTVSVTDSLGCTSPTQSITVTVNPALTLATIPDTNICSGNSVTLNANANGGDGNYTYTWMPGTLNGASQTLSPSTTTTYSVIVSDGCTTPPDTTIITVTVNPNPSATITSTTDVSCFGGSNGAATVVAGSGTSPYTYAWTPAGGSAASANSLQAGNYSVTVTDSLGCTQTQTLTITQPTQITATAISSPEHCTNADGSASVVAAGGNPGYTYLWSNSSTNDSIGNVAAGPYTVTITDNTGCSVVDTIIVGNTGNANANAGPSVTITNGQSTTLNGSGGITFSWSPSTDLSCSNCPNPVATPTVTTIYTLTVTDVNGCTGTDTMTVYVDVACGDVFIPNAFSPNGDGSNDTLYVRGNCIKYMDFQVYNRWGEKVFQTGNPANGWDGTWRGQECEAAIFTYVLRVTLKDDTLVDKQGTITLVK